MSMAKKVAFTWKLPGWTWEATRYEGNGVFYGKVTSPFTPSGEYGTWYLWEIENEGAKLVSGDGAVIDKIRQKTKKTATFQKSLFGD
jgi:hypothetical protein